ncbi:hypothetical protein [Pontibacter sp. Tf4]|uniref:hypothetical protein n=1 Tax=Pontibacter sp. Tf4 TaxID=2761620 RepID=UPI0016269231|nr:hypothetical protein [Pontibacter sp. Tf4]
MRTPVETIKDKTMNNLRTYLPALIVVLMLTMSSCELVGDIFKAGMWTALIIIVLIVVLLAWIFRKLRR